MASIERSGDIHQDNVSGTAIAHTGIGNIIVQVESANFTVESSQLVLAQGALSVGATVRQTLPRDVATFTGREKELQSLVESVAESSQTGSPILIHAIDGMAGVGKTALAVHAAHQLTGQFPDGQLFLRLNAHGSREGPVEAGDALAALLRETGLDARQIPASLDEKERLWRGRLAGRRVLLLLDDAADHQQVQSLLPGTSGSAVLVTSRHRLASLEGALSVPLDVMLPGEARRLFARLTGRDDVRPEDAAELMQLAGHLPLAIMLLAGRLRHHRAWAVTDLIEELTSARDRSAAIGATDEPISATFDLSYNRLPASRQLLLRYLGLNPGNEIDAYALTALAGFGLQDARRELDALFTCHLIDEPTRGRYRFHDLLADYARALAVACPPEEQDAAIDRLLDYYVHVAQIADRYLTRQSHPNAQTPGRTRPAHKPNLSSWRDAVRWMTAERSNLSAVAGYSAMHNRPAHVAAISTALNGFLLTFSFWDQALALHQVALDSARRATDRPAEAAALGDLGAVQRLVADHEAARANLGASLALYRDLGDRLGEANALSTLGLVERLAGDFEMAGKSLGLAESIYRELGEQLGLANTLHDLGYQHYLSDEYVAARTCLTEALALYRALGNETGQANALNYLGVVQHQVGDLQAAAASQERALELYSVLGIRNGQANALNALGTVQYLMADFPAATASVERALTLYRTLNNRLGEANALKRLGQVQFLTGEIPAATANLTQALSMFRELRSRLGEANALTSLSQIQKKEGQLGVAASGASMALALYRALGDRSGQAHALAALGHVQLMIPQVSEAAASFTEALEIFRSLGDRPGEAESLNNLGELACATSQVDKALACFEHALAIATSANEHIEQARALVGIGRLYTQAGRHESAETSLSRALEMYTRIGVPAAREVAAMLRSLDPSQSLTSLDHVVPKRTAAGT
ncbi:MAG TPA: tetratricopeptide repeat protein [Streptosporangiaceae bacterium]|nr:tetratricopeptide repeat protein [Streptosporangiaceae bacterium]